MSTQHFAVIGHPIGHTMSPFIHKRLFEIAGVDADYTKIDVAPESLGEEFKNTLSKLDGFNVTIPHKQNIIQYLDEIDKKAEMYGSVNTVSVKDGKSKGYTTDPDGFLKALEAAGIELDGRIMILGCGGVARTMAYEIAKKGLEFEFAVRPQDVGKAGLLCLDITRKIPGTKVSFGLMTQIIGTVDVLINATPVGMYPNADEQPIHNCAIGRCGAVFDAVYNPLTIRSKPCSLSAQRRTAQRQSAECQCSFGRRRSRKKFGTARALIRKILTGCALKRRKR